MKAEPSSQFRLGQPQFADQGLQQALVSVGDSLQRFIAPVGDNGRDIFMKILPSAPGPETLHATSNMA
jgi:hypothetical protein